MLPNLDIFFAPICHLIKSSPATTYLQDIKIKVMVLILLYFIHSLEIRDLCMMKLSLAM